MREYRQSFTEDTQHVLASSQSVASGKPNVSRANNKKHGNSADRKKVVSRAGNLILPHLLRHCTLGRTVSSGATELKTLNAQN